MLSPDSDSVGNVKKMPTFAATRALFENASFSGGGRTPTEKPVTPSRHVKDMIATYRPPVAEVSSPPPVSVRHRGKFDRRFSYLRRETFHATAE